MGPFDHRATSLNVRVPLAGEVVAATLRRMILNGELKDGDRLPRQEDLLRAFNVSHPSLREGLRMLEAEGLITVQRGKVGGAFVRVPKAGGISYSFGMVLQAEQVPLTDLADALSSLEPICFGLAASSPNRKDVLVPLLSESCDKLAELVPDPVEFTVAAREFHELVVDNCGNNTMRLAVGVSPGCGPTTRRARSICIIAPDGRRLFRSAARSSRPIGCSPKGSPRAQSTGASSSQLCICAPRSTMSSARRTPTRGSM